MKDIFKQIFKTAPSKEDNGIYYFGDENDGDCFDKSDAVSWQNEIFSRNWKKRELLDNNASRHLLDEIIAYNEYIVDLACGPGMGFIPSIKQTAPEFRCLATDANSLVLSEWKRYLQNNEKFDKYKFFGFLQFFYNVVEKLRSGRKIFRTGAIRHETARFIEIFHISFHLR